MSPDLVWLMIGANVTIAVVTIANTWALAWYNKRQTDLSEPETERKDIEKAQKRVYRRVIFPSSLMFLVSIAGIVSAALLPASSVTIQILRISGFFSATVLSVVFVLFGFFILVFRTHVSSTNWLFGVVDRLVAIVEKQVGD